MDMLTFGTTGHNHLLAAAQKAFRLAQEPGNSGDAAGLVSTGARLFCMAWSEFPLNTPLAAEIVRLAGMVPAVGSVLTGKGVSLAGRLAGGASGESYAEPQALFDQGDYSGLNRFFETNTHKGDLLPMVRQAYLLQGLLSNWQWLEGYLHQALVPADPELAELLLADVHLSSGKYDQAVMDFEKLVASYGLAGWGFRLATAQAGAGDTAGSLKTLGRVLADFPEHTSALLRMDSLAFPAPSTRLDGKCVVSIYSYNKSDELSQTLDSLLESNLGPGVGEVSVRVLINGSEDNSLEVAKRARDKFEGAMDVVSLPVNVGAPAARNWLLDAACRDGGQWIAYLDDDVLLPKDWLSGFASGVEAFPEAGVWGCRVGDAMSSGLTQHGDGFLLSREDATQQQHELVLHEQCVECLVPLQLDYRRYAASVTGCCHLFKVDTLAGAGGFDLHFSPSQFDDLDLDLRQLQAGRPAAYLGDVQVTHLRPSNHFLKLSESANVRSETHRSLLEKRHSGNLETLRRVQDTYIRADLAAKRKRLEQAGLLLSG